MQDNLHRKLASFCNNYTNQLEKDEGETLGYKIGTYPYVCVILFVLLTFFSPLRAQ